MQLAAIRFVFGVNRQTNVPPARASYDQIHSILQTSCCLGANEFPANCNANDPSAFSAHRRPVHQCSSNFPTLSECPCHGGNIHRSERQEENCSSNHHPTLR